MFPSVWFQGLCYYLEVFQETLFVCLFVCNSAQKRERSRAAVCLLLPVLEAVPPLKIYGNNAPALGAGGSLKALVSCLETGFLSAVDVFFLV